MDAQGTAPEAAEHGDAENAVLIDDELPLVEGNSRETLGGESVVAEDVGGGADVVDVAVVDGGGSIEKLPGEEVTPKLEESIVEELESLPDGAVSVPSVEVVVGVVVSVPGDGAALPSEGGSVEASVATAIDRANETGIHAPATKKQATAVAKSEQDAAMDMGEDDSSSEDEGLVVTDSNAAKSNAPAAVAENAGRRPPDVARMKSSLCSYFRKKGCRHGEKCNYAHGESELQQRPDGTWDPTSERAKQMNVMEKVEPADAAAAAPAVQAPEQAGHLHKCIVHVPRGWSQQKLKSFLDEHGVPYTSAKKRKAMSVCFVGFDNQEQVTKSAQILDGMSVQNKRLKFADVLPRAWEQKAVGVTESALADDTEDKDAAAGEDVVMTEDGLGEDPAAGAAEDKKVLEPYRDVCQVVTPLAHLSYEEQLNTKKESIVQVLKRLARNIRKGCPPGILLPDWLAAAKDREGLPCEFEGVLPSPIVDGYRNKCEFSIGSGPDGKRVVGFQLGTFREGVNAVADPGNCRNVSSIALGFVAAFQTFIRTSKLPVWNKTDNTGFWRMLTIREGRKPASGADGSNEIAEVMLVAQVCPTGVSEERRAEEYSQMTKALIETATTATPQLPLTALLVQDHVGISNAAAADSPLHALPLPGLDEIRSKDTAGDDSPAAHIHDYIGDLRFRISPTAFFQVNSTGAERLYSLAGDWARLGPETLLFDVCCGTGTIGLTLAKRVGMVVGIEMNASAVADAQLNAELNGISNCRFVCGKAEDVIQNLLKEYAIEDPADKEDAPETTAANEGDEGSARDTEMAVGEGDAGASNAGKDEGAGKKDVTKTDEAAGKSKVEPKPRFTNIVAIVDPPRVGLHHMVLRTLRLHKQLRRLVYISCNPDSLLANAVELCMPLKDGPVEKVKGRGGGFRGTTNLGHARRRVKNLPASEPFRPVKAAAVDLFPHTKHCEMVMLFER